MKAGEQQSPEEDKVSTKNKKDYFEGYKAPLNNTFTGDAIRRLFPQQSKMTEMGGSSAIGAAIFVLVQLLKVAVIVTVAIGELVANGFRALANGISALALGIRANNKPAQTKQTDFLSEEDVNNSNNHDPRSSTENESNVVAESDIVDPTIPIEQMTIQQPPLTKSPSKVDDTAQQMEGFTHAQNHQLTTIGNSPGPETGPDSKEENVAKLGPNNNRG